MAASLSWKIYVYVTVALALAFTTDADTDVMLGHRKHVPGYSLGPAPFPDFKDMDYELFQDAFLRDDSVKVTDAEQHQRGAIWAKKAYDLDEHKNEFQADFKFRVGGSANKEFFGDGFALWFVHKKRGVGGTALGGPNKFEGFAVFFDTYKNHQFKGKRHPYVYGIVNDNTKDYDDITTADVENQGCHIPLRNADPETLDTTIARVTYKSNKLSVVMQPEGADDWVKCFQIQKVQLPKTGFFGVTAMTGDLVDKHQMVSIEVFSRIFEDPWRTAADHDVTLMPDMWNDMKYSGDVAREFETWEEEMEKDLSWSLKEHYGEYIDPYYGYSGNYEYVTDDTYDDPDDTQAHLEKRKVKPSYKNNFQKGLARRRRLAKDRAREGGGHKRLSSHLSNEDLSKIDDMLADTGIANEIGEIHQKKHERIKKLRQHLEAEFSQAADQMTDLLRKLSIKEHELRERINNLGKKLHVNLDETMQVESGDSFGWLWPFVFMLLLVMAGTAYGFTKYRTHMKTHLL